MAAARVGTDYLLLSVCHHKCCFSSLLHVSAAVFDMLALPLLFACCCLPAAFVPPLHCPCLSAVCAW